MSVEYASLFEIPWRTSTLGGEYIFLDLYGLTMPELSTLAEYVSIPSFASCNHELNIA